MDKVIKKLGAEVKRGKNLEQTLKELLHQVASAYGMLSFYNLDMELSMFLEAKEEELIKPDKFIKELEESLIQIMKKTVLPPFSAESYENSIEELTALRDKVIARVDMLGAYADLFLIYEYSVNHLEAVFEPNEQIVAMDNDETAREILQWIFSEEEPAIINTHIKDMLFCLPMRMTKNKFLELVENSFSIYKNSDAESVDLFCYMLRSAAGLHTPKGMARTYPKLDKAKKLFESKPLSELTKEEYMERKEAMEAAADYIHNATECFGAVQGIINALLTLLLTRSYFTPKAEKQSEQAGKILAHLVSGGSVDTENLFEGIENEMESISEAVAALEPLLSFVGENLSEEVEKQQLSKIYDCLLMAQRMNSGSSYASLLKEEKKDEAGYLQKVKNSFLSDLQKAFKEGSRIRNRAIMALVLRELPVYFNNRTEVMNYVRTSLDGCRDENEKQICMNLLRTFMEEPSFDNFEDFDEYEE